MYSFKPLHAYYPYNDADVKETYILGDFNINMCENNKYIVHENNTVSTKLTSADAKKYINFHLLKKCRVDSFEKSLAP